jgi:hypothetical protein
MEGLPRQGVMPGVKITSFASLTLGSVLLLGSVALGQTQKWAPMPVPAGTVIPVNSHRDSQGNTYAIGTNTVGKTTPAGVTTVIATAHQFDPTAPIPFYDYYFSDLAVDSLDNVYVAETANGLGGSSSQYPVELILKITPAGTITTFTVVDGQLRLGRVPNRCTLTVTPAGNLYTVGPAGSIFAVAADGSTSVVAPDAWFFNANGSFNNPPQGLTSDENGVLYTTVSRLNVQVYVGALEIRPLTTVPLVTFQPQGGTIAFGSTKSLTVVAAVDGGPLSYQWYRDGGAIDGANGTMRDIDLDSGEALKSNSFSASYAATLPGTYTIVISAGNGSAVISDGAVVITVGPGGIPVGRTPLITTQPADGVFDYGSGVSLSVAALSTLPLSYQWQLDDKDLPQATGSSYTATESGSYAVIVSTDIGSVTSRVATVALANRPVNVSTRVRVGTADDVAIAGFIISGPVGRTKRVLLRAVGPGLIPFGLSSSEVLAQPILSVFDAKGLLFATNRGWNDLEPVAAAAKATGAFALPAGSRDAAMMVDLPPGSYTAKVSGENGTTGIVLVEVYERAPDSSHFVNISTRGAVGSGGNILIGGFVAGGVYDSRMLIRAVGPGLTASGVPGALTQPVLSVYDASGQLIAINVGWSNGTSAEALAIAAASSRIGAFALQPGSTDCAMLLSLRPGAYTVQVTGVNGATGVALFEAYQVPGN